MESYIMNKWCVLQKSKRQFKIQKLNYEEKTLDKIQQIFIIIAFSKLGKELPQSIKLE